MSDSPDSRTLTAADLLDMIVQLRAEVAGLSAESAALKDTASERSAATPDAEAGRDGAVVQAELACCNGSEAAVARDGRSSPKSAVLVMSRHRARGFWRTSFVVQDLTIGAGAPLWFAPVTPTRRQIILGSGPHDAR